MERDPDQVMQYLEEVEQLAEDVLADRQNIVDLDRRRNKTREAMRALQKDKTDKKQWVCFGNTFIKLPKKQTTSMLRKDFDKLDDEIDKIRNGLKPKIAVLRDMEQKDEKRGFNLQPLSKEELESVTDALNY